VDCPYHQQTDTNVGLLLLFIMNNETLAALSEPVDGLQKFRTVDELFAELDDLDSI